MMKLRKKPSVSTVFTRGTVAALLLGGCQPTPPAPGATGGRMDPYRSTVSDRKSHKASMPALYEFSDQTAASLARELVDIDEIKNAAEPVVLELGDLRNMTETPTQDFEQIQHRIRGHLLGSTLVRRHFRIVESAARMDRELRRVDAEGAERTARYDPNITYQLIGDFFESRRDPIRRYYFEFKLVHLASRAIAFHQQFDLTQR